MKETNLKIRVLGDPVLRRRSKPVKKITEHHRQLLAEMARLMYTNSGIGLAAPQVGVGERLIVVDSGSGLYKLINPRIIKRQGKQVLAEGCLSVPDVSIKVKRARSIVIKAQDENASPCLIEAQDLLACVFQHEIDHLDGKLIVDYASLWDKIKLRSRRTKKL